MPVMGASRTSYGFVPAVSTASGSNAGESGTDSMGSAGWDASDCGVGSTVLVGASCGCSHCCSMSTLSWVLPMIATPADYYAATPAPRCPRCRLCLSGGLCPAPGLAPLLLLPGPPRREGCQR